MFRSDYDRWKDLPPVSPDELRQALRQFASGVTIVTTQHDGIRYGITVSAFASVTLQPPTVMVSINSESQLADMIQESQAFAVHILAEDQAELSQRFSAAIDGDEKFGNLPVAEGVNGVPILDHAMARFECVLDRTIRVGTHVVMFGKVVGTDSDPDPAWPLLYYHREYHRLNRPEQSTQQP
ncbi:MAG: flavin reductase [Chlorobi bacterium]|nr:MAG: FMN reductase (NADH) NtaB [Chlorobi bacterium OLB7]MBK8912418.1 flavin reductase [Chlorobiota bacterium]MBX7218107.1 flavin reductase family protein [Candidatus Kapabacteria bacterium]